MVSSGVSEPGKDEEGAFSMRRQALAAGAPSGERE